MITITRRLAHDLRVVMRRALPLSRRGTEPPVHVKAGPEGVRIRAQCADAALEYHQPGKYPAEEITIPAALLADCEAKSEAPVQIEVLGDGRVLATWQDGPIPHRLPYDAPVTTRAPEFPGMPESLASNPPELLVALAEATCTSDSGSVRFALGCVRLTGDSGEIAATDGRQLLVHSGFSFP